MVSKEKRQQVIDMLKKGDRYVDIRNKTGISLGFISGVSKAMGALESDGQGFIKASVRKIFGQNKTRNILVVGDLHAPFIREGYLEFCQEQYEKWNCNQVVFTGDVIDSHFSSYHETFPDGMSAGDELEASIKQLKPWHDAFPKASVCIGNHDLLVKRKAISSGVSERWVKDLADVLEVPGWDFALNFTFDDVFYYHGEGQKPHIRMLHQRQSCVGGHNHSTLSVIWSVSKIDRLFGFQVGWGGNQEAYAIDYAKNHKRGIVSAGVVLENGTIPIPLPMPL